MTTLGTSAPAHRTADAAIPLWERTVGDVLRAAAAAAPDQVALVEAGPAEAQRRSLTYAELLAASEQVARALLARFRPGEHVAVWAGNGVEWVLLEYGAGLAGLVLVTVNPAYQSSELGYVLRRSRSSGLFHMPQFRGNPMTAIVEEVRAGLPDLREVVALDGWDAFVSSADPATELPAVAPNGHVQIQYTSGTTGFPKGVLLHHRGLVNNARLSMECMDARAGDVLVWPMPLFHTAGCGLGVLGAACAGVTLVLLAQFDPERQLALIESERATHSGGVPTMLIAMLNHRDAASRDLSSLRVVASGGAPVPADLAQAWERRFPVRFSIMFGTTECSPIISFTRLDDPPEVRTGTLGRPLPHTDVMIAGPDGRPVAVGVVGELCARGYLVMDGYFDDPEATAAVIDADGWYHTGDLASMDASGCLRVEGRLKDMIIRGGENIYPREIEDALHAHPAVLDVAVVGRPDPTWGETVAAFVRTAPGASVTTDELRAFCRERLAAYKTPVEWIVVDEFPLTASGKIRKNVLRERLGAH